MLKINNISKKYLDNEVIQEISVDFPSGKLITLLGVNGAGKSTFLRLISGAELPDSGNVEFKGSDLGSLRFPYKNEIGFVDENIDYSIPISFGEFVEKISIDIKNWDQSFFNQMAKDRKISLDKTFQEYSRGQKMQLSLMLNLAMKPKILFLDEITSVMDTYARKYFLEILKDYVKAGNTVIITTNIVNELEFFTDHLMIIKEGKLALNVAMSEIKKEFVKIRRIKGVKNKIFDDPKCFWAGTNSDHTPSYIIKSDLALKYEISDEIVDRRSSTMEDIFIYYFSEVEEGEL